MKWTGRWNVPVDRDLTIKGLMDFFTYGAGALLVWSLLSQYQLPWGLEFLGMAVNPVWLTWFCWAASVRFLYRAMLGIRLMQLSGEFLDMQHAWAWIDQQEREWNL